MDDGARLPATFDEWEETAKRHVASAAANGIEIQPIIVDPEEFLAFCKVEDFEGRGGAERAHFAIARGAMGRTS